MWQVAVYNERQHDQFRASSATFSLVRTAGEYSWRLVDGREKTPGADAIRISANSNRALVIDCRDLNSDINVGCGSSFSSAIPIELPLPSVFQIADSWVEVREESDDAALHLEPLLARHLSANDRSRDSTAIFRGPDSETVAKWLAAAGQIHRIAASSPTFFDAAAQVALDSTGLDAAMILIGDDNNWTIAGSAVPRPEYGISFEPSAIEHVRSQPEVWRREPRIVAVDATYRSDINESPIDESIVVAPVLSDAGDVVAVVYGVRHGRGDNRREGIRTLEARVIEQIADAVAVGMARRQQEINSARQRVLLEQAFSPTVVEHLHRHPEALSGQTREVTLLFADLRGFTKLAETLPPADSCGLLASVMEALTLAIMNYGGTVIDYYGDGVSAMWNAPLEMPDHTDRACTAAIQMLEALPAISRQWESLLPEPLQLGIGVHAGTVQVGNAGTQQRLKYGPRGSAVNIASRVQSAAKRLDVALLATDAVRKRLSSRFVTLKVCTARLPGLEEPLELFTVFPSTDALRLQADLERYAVALEAFEQGDLVAAEEQLSNLLAKGPATPAVFLAQQTAALRQGSLGRRATDEVGYTPDAVIEILAK